MSGPSVEQRGRALAAANARRISTSAAKRRVATGARTITDVLADQDDALGTMLLPDVLLLSWRFGYRRLRRVGRRAAIARVNLLVTLADAPHDTRAWLIAELTPTVVPLGQRLSYPAAPFATWLHRRAGERGWRSYRTTATALGVGHGGVTDLLEGRTATVTAPTVRAALVAFPGWTLEDIFGDELAA